MPPNRQLKENHVLRGNLDRPNFDVRLWGRTGPVSEVNDTACPSGK